jgi:ABC-type uncharacterized transport system auxiliary subunit
VLLVLAGILVGSLWLARVQFSAQYQYVETSVAGPVSGLSTGAIVRLNGIRGRTKFDYHATSLWTDRVRALAQILTVEAFENDGSIAQAGRKAQDLTPEYLLGTEIRRFERSTAGWATSRPPPSPVKMTDHRMLARTLLVERSSTSSNSVESVVEAFDVAVGKILPQCVAWATSVMRRGG